MVRRGHTVDRRVTAALAMLALTSLACAGDRTRPRSVTTAAPMEIPHTVNLVLAEHARKRNPKPANRVNSDFLVLTPGLLPVQWPSHTETLRTSMLTPQLKSAPVVGWIAENLYRSKADNGWSVELDGGEYQVLYRYHPKR